MCLLKVWCKVDISSETFVKDSVPRYKNKVATSQGSNWKIGSCSCTNNDPSRPHLELFKRTFSWSSDLGQLSISLLFRDITL